MLKMLAFCIILILAEPAFVTMDIVRSTGNVGDKIYMPCFNQTDQVFQPIRAVTWTYAFHDDCTDTSTNVTVARCDHGSWDYVLYGHKLVDKDSDITCGNGLEFMEATKPGNFTYKCQGMFEETNVMKEVTFVITIHRLDDSRISPCLAKYVPSSQNLIFDFICKNYHQRDCLNEEEWDNELFFQHNGVRIIPNITLANKIVARIGLENISSISQYNCINQNHSSPCVVDNVAFYNPIGISPIVNRVLEGGDAIFECNFKDGHERGVKYEWSLSRQINFSRTDLGLSGISYSTVKISDVKFEDDSVVVTCAITVNDTIFYSEALLKIFFLGGFSTTASYSADTTNLLPLATQLFNHTTATTSTQYICPDSCKPIMMYFLIPVFGVLLIAAVIVLAVYWWTRDIPGLPSADATYDVVQI